MPSTCIVSEHTRLTVVRNVWATRTHIRSWGETQHTEYSSICIASEPTRLIAVGIHKALSMGYTGYTCMYMHAPSCETYPKRYSSTCTVSEPTRPMTVGIQSIYGLQVYTLYTAAKHTHYIIYTSSMHCMWTHSIDCSWYTKPSLWATIYTCTWVTYTQSH